MMVTKRLDENNDWTFGNGLANYLKDNEATLQNVMTRLKSFKNDWFLDTETNIDWFNILGSKTNEATIIKEIERVTLETEGVVRVNSIKLTYDSDNGNREASVFMDIATAYSEANILNLTI